MILHSRLLEAGPVRPAARVGIGQMHGPYRPPPSQLRASPEEAA